MSFAQGTSENSTKVRAARAAILFFLIQSIRDCFLLLSLPFPSSLA